MNIKSVSISFILFIKRPTRNGYNKRGWSICINILQKEDLIAKRPNIGDFLAEDIESLEAMFF